MPKGKGQRRSVPVPESSLLERVIEFLETNPGSKTSDVSDQLEVPQLQVRNELMQLEARGEVHRTGQTRGTRWFLGNTNLSPAAETNEEPARRGPKERKLDDFRDVLGNRPDAEIADRTGVSVRTIAAYRKKHGITGYTGPRRRGEASSSSFSGNAAWRVEFRRDGDVVARYTLGSDLVSVAQAASERANSEGAEVTGIAWVGDAL